MADKCCVGFRHLTAPVYLCSKTVHQLGMQAGRAQPPTRWANPHRIPAIRRIAARDSETGLRGQPARASGAAKPAKTNQRRLPPLACAASARFTCAASSSFLAMVGTAPRPPPPPPPPPCRRHGPLLSFLAGAASPRLHPRGQGKGREGIQAEIEERAGLTKPTGPVKPPPSGSGLPDRWKPVEFKSKFK
ncbi:hypothetical protein PVAP13_3NG141373 [Panicum virgatum]|uniref:Uncharacterized protein n=1 Tax=Panicum virgatum TaxID=38727 RepID=A0A8T0UAJ5_PANVG|nr:hypothetical protein PVAP13_3NG141373 [Panicum virgatum]